jgi:L-cysteine S-thiosulfotransferase
LAFALPAAYNPGNTAKNPAGNALNDTSSKPGFLTGLALALALLIGAVTFSAPARAQSTASEGQKLAFDRGKGNCLTCHVIKGGDLPGTIGPELKDIKSKYPDRADLVAIVNDETKRNPQTVMPPFGRNRILTEQEINAVVDFLQTL